MNKSIKLIFTRSFISIQFSAWSSDWNLSPLTKYREFIIQT